MLARFKSDRNLQSVATNEKYAVATEKFNKRISQKERHNERTV
jgi:hypothetical protein